MKKVLIIVAIVLAVIVVLYLLWKKFGTQLKDTVINEGNPTTNNQPVVVNPDSEYAP